MDTGTQKEHLVKMKAEVKCSYAKKKNVGLPVSHQKLGEGHTIDSPLTLEGINAALNLHARLWPPELKDSVISVVQCLPGMHELSGSIFSKQKRKHSQGWLRR